ncbi:hypothetical protein C8J57DRAFT_1235158 [Mycena rebaudengoi]|nr:hypothetical protein C8J57DRAFT_1235158 [Mycena rebaudengoi]
MGQHVATLGLRVPAMYGFDLRVLVPMSIILAISVALGLWTIIKFGEPGMLTAPALNLTGCETALLRATTGKVMGRTVHISEFLYQCLKLVFDTVIFGLTAYRAYTDHNVMKLVDGSLIKRMMKDVRRYCHRSNSGMVDYLVRLSASSPTLFLHLLVSAVGCVPPPTCTEDPDSTKLDVIRFKDPRPPQPLEEATFDDEDFELVAERENARIREYLPDSAAELVNQTNREGDRAQIHALDFWWDMALAAPRFASSMA